MKTTCPYCQTELSSKETRFLPSQTLKDHFRTIYSKLFRFYCKNKKCGERFYIRVDIPEDPSLLPITGLGYSDALFNQASKSKPGANPFSTTASEYTCLIKRDPASIHQALLKRLAS